MGTKTMLGTKERKEPMGGESDYSFSNLSSSSFSAPINMATNAQEANSFSNVMINSAILQGDSVSGTRPPLVGQSADVKTTVRNVKQINFTPISDSAYLLKKYSEDYRDDLSYRVEKILGERVLLPDESASSLSSVSKSASTSPICNASKASAMIPVFQNSYVSVSTSATPISESISSTIPYFQLNKTSTYENNNLQPARNIKIGFEAEPHSVLQFSSHSSGYSSQNVGTCKGSALNLVDSNLCVREFSERPQTAGLVSYPENMNLCQGIEKSSEQYLKISKNGSLELENMKACVSDLEHSKSGSNNFSGGIRSLFLPHFEEITEGSCIKANTNLPKVLPACRDSNSQVPDRRRKEIKKALSQNSYMLSPTSSYLTCNKLEWDSGADIGYNCIKDNEVKNFSLQCADYKLEDWQQSHSSVTTDVVDLQAEMHKMKITSQESKAIKPSDVEMQSSKFSSECFDIGISHHVSCPTQTYPNYLDHEAQTDVYDFKEDGALQVNSSSEKKLSTQNEMVEEPLNCQSNPSGYNSSFFQTENYLFVPLNSTDDRDEIDEQRLNLQPSANTNQYLRLRPMESSDIFLKHVISQTSCETSQQVNIARNFESDNQLETSSIGGSNTVLLDQMGKAEFSQYFPDSTTSAHPSVVLLNSDVENSAAFGGEGSAMPCGKLIFMKSQDFDQLLLSSRSGRIPVRLCPVGESEELQDIKDAATQTNGSRQVNKVPEHQSVGPVSFDVTETSHRSRSCELEETRAEAKNDTDFKFGFSVKNQDCVVSQYHQASAQVGHFNGFKLTDSTLTKNSNFIIENPTGQEHISSSELNCEQSNYFSCKLKSGLTTSSSDFSARIGDTVVIHDAETLNDLVRTSEHRKGRSKSKIVSSPELSSADHNAKSLQTSVAVGGCSANDKLNDLHNFSDTSKKSFMSGSGKELLWGFSQSGPKSCHKRMEPRSNIVSSKDKCLNPCLSCREQKDVGKAFEKKETSMKKNKKTSFKMTSSKRHASGQKVKFHPYHSYLKRSRIDHELEPYKKLCSTCSAEKLLLNKKNEHSRIFHVMHSLNDMILRHQNRVRKQMQFEVDCLKTLERIVDALHSLMDKNKVPEKDIPFWKPLQCSGGSDTCGEISTAENVSEGNLLMNESQQYSKTGRNTKFNATNHLWSKSQNPDGTISSHVVHPSNGRDVSTQTSYLDFGISESDQNFMASYMTSHAIISDSKSVKRSEQQEHNHSYEHLLYSSKGGDHQNSISWTISHCKTSKVASDISIEPLTLQEAFKEKCNLVSLRMRLRKNHISELGEAVPPLVLNLMFGKIVAGISLEPIQEVSAAVSTKAVKKSVNRNVFDPSKKCNTKEKKARSRVTSWSKSRKKQNFASIRAKRKFPPRNQLRSKVFSKILQEATLEGKLFWPRWDLVLPPVVINYCI